VGTRGAGGCVALRVAQNQGKRSQVLGGATDRTCKTRDASRQKTTRRNEKKCQDEDTGLQDGEFTQRGLAIVLLLFQ